MHVFSSTHWNVAGLSFLAIMLAAAIVGIVCVSNIETGQAKAELNRMSNIWDQESE
jgi:hypothetical protein